jgi:hypothetical protein
MDNLASGEGHKRTRLHPGRRIASVPNACMPQPVAERVKKLRNEIAEINEANRAYVHDPKYGSAVADHERRFQRLLEIVNELDSLTDWKKP